MDLRDREKRFTAMAADYRSIYYIDLDKDECTCVRAAAHLYGEMQEGRVFPFLKGFSEYARHCVAEADREAFLDFIKPENIRAGLAGQSMLSHRYLSVKDGVEAYEMLRFAGVSTIGESDDQTVHTVGAGFSGVDQETRELMEQNRALSEALTRAEEANAAKTAFLSSMSHEIRTPMNAIIGLDKIALKDQKLSRETRDELEKIGSSARHLLALINDILDMSRIESGRMELKEEAFSLREMVGQINVIINGQCEDKGLHFICNRDESTDEYFLGDDLRLKQILINILGNAVKFTDPPGTITFTVKQTDREDQAELCFTMVDTGIGMDPSFIPRLFEPFVQEDATATNRYGGSGIGMAITKKIVDLMGGRLEVQSEKGRGTTFTVRVLLRHALPSEITQDSYDQPGQEVSLEGIHVLIAEDMEVNAEILSDLLEMEEITSEWADNGQSAVEMFEQSEEGHYSVILMDMRMPVMDGLTATREIRKLARPDAAAVPIIALTANAFEEDVKQCLEAGMNAHLSKPVDIDRLKILLRRLLTADETSPEGDIFGKY